MGGTLVVGPLYSAVGRQWQQTPEMRKEDLARTAKNLRVSADYAEKRGVRLALEPLNRFETSFINLTEQALELVELIGSPAVGLMMDTFHANIEEKRLGKAIEMAGDKLWHVHANENDRGIPGTGHVPWSDVGAALKKINYSGALVIESFSHRGQRDRPRRGRLAPVVPLDRQPGCGWHGVLEAVDGVVGRSVIW